MRTVQHWIDGKPWDGAAARTGDVFDPSTGAVQAQVALAGPTEIDAAVQSAQPGVRWSGARSRSSRRVRILFAFREVLERRKDELAAAISAEHGKVLSDALGEVGARPGGRRVRVRDPAPAEGRVLGVGLDRHRRALDPPAARRRRRHHAVQLPGDGPDVDVPGRDRVRERVRAQAERPRPVGVAGHRGAVGRGRAARRRVHRAAGRQGGGRRTAHPSRRPRGELRRLDAGRAPRLRDRGDATASGCRRSVARRTTWSCCPTPTSSSPPTRRSSAGYGSAGERCMAISVVVAVGDVARSSWSTQIAARIARGAGRRRATTPDSEMGPLVTARAPRPGARATSTAGSPRAPSSSSTGARPPCPDDGLLPRPVPLRPGRRRRWRCTATRSSGRCCRWCGSRPTTTRSRLISENPYGNGVAIFTRDGGAARRFEHEVDAGMVGVNVPIPVPMAYYSFGGWKQSLFGDTHVHGPEGVHFYTRARSSRAAGPTPSTRGPDLGFPTT